jgi:hypothetical protein
MQQYETTCQLGTTFKSIFPCQHMCPKKSIHSKTWDFIRPIYILKLINILKMFCVKMTLLKSESPSCKLPHELIGLHEPLQWLVLNHQMHVVIALKLPIILTHMNHVWIMLGCWINSWHEPSQTINSSFHWTMLELLQVPKHSNSLCNRKGQHLVDFPKMHYVHVLCVWLC